MSDETVNMASAAPPPPPPPTMSSPPPPPPGASAPPPPPTPAMRPPEVQQPPAAPAIPAHVIIPPPPVDAPAATSAVEPTRPRSNAYQPPPSSVIEDDPFDSVETPRDTGIRRQTRRPGGPRGRLISVGAKGGGVGKTTVATHMAERIAMKGISTCLIDYDRSQGDVRKRLNLQGPTMSEIVLRWDGHPDRLQDFIVVPTDRGLKAHYILGPRTGMLGAATVVSDIDYGEVIDVALTLYEVVVVDTHPLDASLDEEQFSTTLLPRLIGNPTGTMVVVSDWDRAKAWNALEWTARLEESGMSTSRIAVLFNEHDAAGEKGMEKEGLLSRFRSALVLDPLPESSEVATANNQHRLGFADQAYTAAIDAALYQILGDEAFLPTQVKKNRWWKRG